MSTGRSKYIKSAQPLKAGSIKDKLIIDMTGVDDGEVKVGATIDIIRKQHILYFNYDPRGLDLKKKLIVDYCEGCRCPSIYCADKVLGSMSYDHAFEVLCEKGSLSDFDSEDWVDFFELAYTRAVENKMRWNSIKFECGHCSLTRYDIPKCVRRGYLRMFKKNMKEQKKRDEHYPDWNDLDMKSDEEIGHV